jgi:hypothetical protein
MVGVRLDGSVQGAGLPRTAVRDAIIRSK